MLNLKLLIAVLVLSFSGLAEARPLTARVRAVQSLCRELLTDSEALVAVDVRGAPGLKILATELHGTKAGYHELLDSRAETFEPYELVSSARYARLIRDRSSESLVMVPGLERKDMPGFDGVILDADGMPVANYSLKTLLTASADRTALKRAWDGVRKATRFSSVEQWLLAYKLLHQDQSGKLYLSEATSAEVRSRKKLWLAKSMKLFGISKNSAKNKRPTRVVVDIQSDLPMPSSRDIEVMKGWIIEAKGLIDSIVFMKGDEILEVK